jgi:FtsX-like permease family protein
VVALLSIAALSSHAPVPPGIARLPGPGEFYASPALTTLLRTVPPAQLGRRYPGTEVGTIGAAALPSPDSLIIVIGHRVADLSRVPGVERINHISTIGPADCNGGSCALGVGTNANGLTLILSVVAAALLFPVLILVGAATRLSATRREQRFAAMRLVGATPQQIAVIATVESVVASAVGVAAGFGLFFATRPALALIPFTGQRFFTTDLSLTLADFLVVVLGIPVAAAVAARIALRRVIVSPLGVTRRVTPPAPSAWRLVPAVLGVAELGFFAYVHDIGAHSGTNTTLEAVAFLAGVLLVMSGLVIAGPWLTLLASRLIVRHARRPAALIAARRLADNPKASFRAVSGLVLAVFVGSCAAGIIATMVADNAQGTVQPRLAHALVDFIAGPGQRHRISALPGSVSTRLARIPGVTAVATIRDEPVPGAPAHVPSRFGPINQLISCRELAHFPALGRCSPGAAAGFISPEFGGSPLGAKPMSRAVWPAAPVSAARLRDLPIDTVVINTNGSTSAVERARTVIDLGLPSTFSAQTASEINATNTQLLTNYQRLAEIVILASLPIAGASLAVSIAGGLADRKRPFGLLRLAGTPLRVLRRVIGLEAAAPMLITAAMSMGSGLLVAQLFVRAQLYESLQAPGLAFYLIAVAGVVAALLIIASTLPLLDRLTGPDAVRNE